MLSSFVLEERKNQNLMACEMHSFLFFVSCIHFFTNTHYLLDKIFSLWTLTEKNIEKIFL